MSPPSTTSSPPRHQSRVVVVDAVDGPASLGNDDDCGGGRATPVSARYKTELCRAFSEHGACRYGDRCQFAHGRADLRAVARHPKYKTDLCRTYHSTGLCPYGPRCHFIHDETSALGGRPPPPPPQPSSAADERRADVARQLQLRLVLLSLCHQRQTSQSTSPNSRLRPKSVVTVDAPAAVRQRHVPLDRRQQLTSFAWTSPTTVVASSASVGGDSSADDDDSPPSRSPTGCHQRQQVLDRAPAAAASNDRLSSLLVLAATRPLLYANQ